MNRRAGMERMVIVRFLRFRAQQAKEADHRPPLLAGVIEKLALAVEAGAHHDLFTPPESVSPALWVTPAGNAFTTPPLDRDASLYVHASRLEDALIRLQIMTDAAKAKTEAVERAQEERDQAVKMAETTELERHQLWRELEELRRKHG